MTAKHFYVYLYEDPRTGKPRYVGKGCGNRVKQHTYNIDTNKWLNTMIRQCRDEGLVVQPKIIECPSASNTGKKRTPEQRANLREGQAKYRARMAEMRKV